MRNFSGNTNNELSNKNLIDQLSDIEKARYLQELLINRCTNGTYFEEHYIPLRNFFMHDNKSKSYLPKYVKECRNLTQFWYKISNDYNTYRDRKQALWEDFNNLMEFLESDYDLPLYNSVDDKLKVLNSENVITQWEKAKDRIKNDPNGAITLSRTMLESVIKNIADERKIDYPTNTNLPKLYSILAKKLNLLPEQHDLEIFKKILGGCSSIVGGLGELRNRHGDAHGKGKVYNYNPSSRHAELAVHIAGSMSLFLIQTHLENTEY